MDDITFTRKIMFKFVMEVLGKKFVVMKKNP